MKKTQHITLKILVAAIGLAATGVQAAAINPGDLVIYRVGTGAAGLTSASTSVFLDEYTTAGTLVQSIALPTSTAGSIKALTASGTASSEGELTISPNGKYIALTGYNAGTGVAGIASTTSTATSRTVGIVNVATGAVDTSTSLTDFSSGNNPRSAVTTNGTDLWVAGAAGGVRSATDGATTSTQLSTTVTNIRQVEIFNNQLYVSDSSGSAIRLGAVGSGEPTTAGQTITNLPGLPTSGSPYSFFFAHVGASGTGPDTLYVADDGIGIIKYSLINSIWQSEGTVGVPADTYRGLTGYVNGTTVNLFATGLGGSGATGGGKLVSIIDTSGVGGAFSATPNLLGNVATNEAFRGVVYVPAATSPVPVPGAVWLFASTIISYLGFRRRKA